MTSKKIIYFIIYYTLFCGFAIKNLNLNKSILLFVDILCLILLLKNKFKIKVTNLQNIVFVLTLLFFFLLVGAGLNNVSLTNFIWGIRNQYMALPLFFAAASFLSIKDIEKILKFFFYFQFLNFSCALYQYFVLGYYEDINNGAFINGSGQDIFCGILMACYLFYYINKKCKLWQLIFVIISSLVIAALEEEKFIFIEAMVLFMYYFFIAGKINLMKIFIAIIFIFILVLSVNMLSDINGTGSLEILTNKDAFISYQENAFELPRIGSSKIISEKFFFSEWQNLFGLGIGNCEDATTLNFIDTSFFNLYGWLNYTFFTFHVNFLQTGWIGIILFILFFIFILINNIKGKMHCHNELKYYYDISIIITLLCMMTIWYNATLRSYNSVIPFFMLSLGSIVTRQNKKINLK